MVLDWQLGNSWSVSSSQHQFCERTCFRVTKAGRPRRTVKSKGECSPTTTTTHHSGLVKDWWCQREKNMIRITTQRKVQNQWVQSVYVVVVVGRGGEKQGGGVGGGGEGAGNIYSNKLSIKGGGWGGGGYTLICCQLKQLKKSGICQVVREQIKNLLQFSKRLTEAIWCWGDH